MSEAAGPGGVSRGDVVAAAVGRLIDRLGRWSTSTAPGRPLDLGVIGYGVQVRDMLGHPAPALTRVSPSLVDDRPALFGRADGPTPMRSAFEAAADLLDGWARSNANSPSPLVVNLCDGASTDGDPVALGTGSSHEPWTISPLLINIHLGVGRTQWLPKDPGPLTADAAFLYELSSPVEGALRQSFTRSGIAARPGARALVSSADASAVSTVLSIVISHLGQGDRNAIVDH